MSPEYPLSTSALLVTTPAGCIILRLVETVRICALTEAKNMYFIRDYDGPRPYQIGSNPDVLILGQDPTIDTHTRFDIVLGLGLSTASTGKESINLQNYIFDDILSPLGIDRSRIIATNLVNLYYYDVPNREIAKAYRRLILETAEREGIDINQYPDRTNGAILHALNFKAKTQGDFERLLSLQSINHMITLGEPVFQVIRERYRLELPMKIQAVLEDVGGEPKAVDICGKRISLLPLPHVFNKNDTKWKFYVRFLQEKLPALATWYGIRPP